MSLEENLGNYIRKRGIKLSVISKETGIQYMAIYDSLFNDQRSRKIKGDELLAICKFLDVSPMDFAEEECNK